MEQETEKRQDKAPAGTVILPAVCYDASLCPKCSGRSDVVYTKAADGLRVRRRKCRDCMNVFNTAELYVSTRRAGRSKEGQKATRLLALEVDALDGIGTGPVVPLKRR